MRVIYQAQFNFLFLLVQKVYISRKTIETVTMLVMCLSTLYHQNKKKKQQYDYNLTALICKWQFHVMHRILIFNNNKHIKFETDIVALYQSGNWQTRVKHNHKHPIDNAVVAVITGTTNLAPYPTVGSIQIIWRSGTHAYRILKCVAEAWLHDSLPRRVLATAGRCLPCYNGCANFGINYLDTCNSPLFYTKFSTLAI